MGRSFRSEQEMDDYYDYGYDSEAEEERLRQERLAWKERLQAMPPQDLGKEYSRQCRRHDLAVDRCEEINSPTIEDAAGQMNWIQKEFERRGLRYFDYIDLGNG